MQVNVGKLDRVLRIVLGIALLVAFFLMPGAGFRWLLLIGLIPLVTGAVKFCPLYRILGLSTCARS